MSQSNRFSVGDVEFEAVRFISPIPHWRPKIVETGEILESGVFNGESRPKMRESIEYFYQRICKGHDNAELRRNLSLGPSPKTLYAAQGQPNDDQLEAKLESFRASKRRVVLADLVEQGSERARAYNELGGSESVLAYFNSVDSTEPVGFIECDSDYILTLENHSWIAKNENQLAALEAKLFEWLISEEIL